MAAILTVTLLMLMVYDCPAETGGPIYSKCAPAGIPLYLQCDTQSIVYVRQTMYSEYYGVPNVNCQLPSYNSLCHTFSNASDFYYNGKYKAEHTFVSERLAFVGHMFGVNCNFSSTVKVVQILYECLTERDYSLDQMYRLSSGIGIPDTNSLTLSYSNGGDTTFLPVMVPRVRTGFWIRYSAFPRTSRIHIVCSVQQEEKANISTGMIAAIGSIAGVCVIVIGLAVVLRIRRNKTDRHVKHVGGSHGAGLRSATFSEVNNEFYFLRRCDTLSSISRCNSLPPNFVFKSKKRKMSSAMSKDSGISIIDIHRNESFKQAVNSEMSKDREGRAAANAEDEETMNQEVTSQSDAEQSEMASPDVSNLEIFQYLSVIGTTVDEVDV